MVHVGVDWASGVWFAVVIGEKQKNSGFYVTVYDLWGDIEDIDRLLIDIFIRLTEYEKRRCDREAKDVLGKRGNSVFYSCGRCRVV
jgi:predicted RNase H-like nuclease